MLCSPPRATNPLRSEIARGTARNNAEGLIDSGVIGVAKPDPAIFDPVLDGLQADPGEILYVGDTYQSDVLGARAAGLQVVQLDPYGLHHDYDHARVPDVGALAELLLA